MHNPPQNLILPNHWHDGERIGLDETESVLKSVLDLDGSPAHPRPPAFESAPRTLQDGVALFSASGLESFYSAPSSPLDSPYFTPTDAVSVAYSPN